MIGFHSVIERPDSVRRVTPPTTTIRNIMAQQTSSHHAIARSPRSIRIAPSRPEKRQGTAPASVFMPG